MSYYTADGARRSVRQRDAYRRRLMGLVLDYQQQESFSGAYMATLRLMEWMARAPGTEAFFVTAPELQRVMREECMGVQTSVLCGKHLRGLTEEALRRIG